MTNTTRSALALAVAARVPTLVWGGPGLGKTSTIREMADAAGWPCEIVIASIREPSDFAGLPVIANEGVDVYMAPPQWAQRLATAGHGLLFLDEVSTAPPAVQAALLRVVLERTVGDLALPEAVAVVAAANPPEQAADGWDLAAPLANRFCHLDWELGPREWADGLLAGFVPTPIPALDDEQIRGVAVATQATIGAFVTARPVLLHAPPTDETAAGRAWPSPRSWAMTARLLAAAEVAGSGDEVAAVLVAGCIGPATAAEFLAWRSELALPDAEDALRNPDDFVLPDRGDRAYAALAAITAAVIADNTPERWAAAWRAIAAGTRNGKPDIAVAAVRSLVQHRPPNSVPPREVLVALAPVLREAGVFDRLLGEWSATEPIDTTRLAAARLRAADLQPFLALALYALTPVGAPGLGTFAVDQEWRLFVDPQALARWSIEENAGVLLHEVGHVIRDHAGRARTCNVDGERDAHLWNLAADAEINDDLRADKVTLPGRHVVPEMLGEPNGRAAEYYYDRLQRGLANDIDIPDCGPGCHGNTDERIAAVATAAPPGLGNVEALLLRRRTAEAIAAALRARPGSVPGGWERWAEAQLHPQLDWRRLLSGAVRGSVAGVTGLSDYSYRRPSRRRVPGVVLPALQRPLPRVAVVVDTSGSVDDELLGLALTEVHGCLRSLGVRRELLTLYATDTQTHKIAKPGQRTVRLEGGGGTDMRAGITTAMEARPRPDLVVVLTDGYTPWPNRAPGAAVVVGLLGEEEHFARADPPAWAKVVRIERVS